MTRTHALPITLPALRWRPMKPWRTPSREEASALGSLISLPAQILLATALMNPATSMPSLLLLGVVTFAHAFTWTTSPVFRRKTDIAIEYLRRRHETGDPGLHSGAVIRIIAAAIIGNLAATFVFIGMASLLVMIVLR